MKPFSPWDEFERLLSAFAGLQPEPEASLALGALQGLYSQGRIDAAGFLHAEALQKQQDAGAGAPA